jgi:nicotinic acid mononucleotide adenylyltransferase
MDKMKNYKQLIKELPSKSVVFAFGRFNPPTIGHELLVKAVKKLASAQGADHAIYASRSNDAKKNPLAVDKKVHYLNLMFPHTHFVAADANVRTFIEAAKELNKKYKNITMVAGSDRISEYEKILNKYNGTEFHFDTVQVISAGERDPDADDASGMSASKMRALATKGDYASFKGGLPSSLRDIDGRRLMNDIRIGMGHAPIKEHVSLVKDELREKYFREEIFNIGDIVESAGIQYTIVKRGSNHLLVKEESGKLVSKWIQDVTLVKESTEMQEELSTKTLKTSDKVKVARIIATMLGNDDAEAMSSPEQLVNNALRKIRSKALNAEALKILSKMLDLATEVGISYDAHLKPNGIKEAAIKFDKKAPEMADDSKMLGVVDQSNNAFSNATIATMTKSKLVGTIKGPKKAITVKEEADDIDMSAYDTHNDIDHADISEEDIDAMIDTLSDEDFYDAYDEDELVVIDDETGEEIPDDGVNEAALMEVLSRAERIRAKVRMAKTKSKRERSARIALHRYSNTATINKRARRMAVKLMKQRIVRGRDVTKLSVGEKERIEATLAKRKDVLNRIATKMVPRIKKMEKARLSHSKYTQSSSPVAI